MLPGAAPAAPRVSYDGSLSMVSGAYGTATTTTQFALTSGLVVEGMRWSLQAFVPIYAQTGTVVLTTGAGGVSPGGQPDHTGPGSVGGSEPGTVAGGYEAAAGDPSVHGSWTMLMGRAALATTRASLKIPLTRSVFGTGEWDAGISFDTSVRGGGYIYGAGVAWWYVGDMPGFSFRNPVLGNLSVSHGGVGGGLATIGVYASTPPWDGAPHGFSMSLSYSRRIGTVRTFVSAGLGLTESVPDVTLAVGWRLSLG